MEAFPQTSTVGVAGSKTSDRQYTVVSLSAIGWNAYDTCKRMVLDDLKIMRNPASNVVNEWSVYYFPHVFSEDYAAGWYDKVEAMQGKYDTYYAGEVMSFGDMDETAEYSRELVERFF